MVDSSFEKISLRHTPDVRDFPWQIIAQIRLPLFIPFIGLAMVAAFELAPAMLITTCWIPGDACELNMAP